MPCLSSPPKRLTGFLFSFKFKFRFSFIFLNMKPLSEIASSLLVIQIQIQAVWIRFQPSLWMSPCSVCCSARTCLFRLLWASFLTALLTRMQQQQQQFSDIDLTQAWKKKGWNLPIFIAIRKSNCRACIHIADITDYGHPLRAFFKVSQIFLLIGQIGQTSCEVF